MPMECSPRHSWLVVCCSSQSCLPRFLEWQLVFAGICDRNVIYRLVKVGRQAYYVAPLLLVCANVRKIEDPHFLSSRQVFERLLVLEKLLLGQREKLVAV